MTVTPHVAQNTTNRRSAIDARTTRHAGSAVSQRTRKRLEEAFGCAATASSSIGWNELIKSKEMQIALTELEAVLLGHPLISAGFGGPGS